MGGIITTVLNFATSIVKRKNKATNDKLKEEELTRQGKTVTPPFFYITIMERNRNLKPEQQYSTSSIFNLLDNGIIPIGYSLSQLESIGFKERVDKFRKRVEDEDKKIIKAYLDAADEIEKEMERDLIRPSPSITNDDLKQFKKILKKRGNVDEEDLIELRTIANLFDKTLFINNKLLSEKKQESDEQRKDSSNLAKAFIESNKLAVEQQLKL